MALVKYRDVFFRIFAFIGWFMIFTLLIQAVLITPYIQINFNTFGEMWFEFFAVLMILILIVGLVIYECNIIDG